MSMRTLAILRGDIERARRGNAIERLHGVLAILGGDRPPARRQRARPNAAEA